MNDERMMILSMLEKGAISKDEAIELLSALDDSTSNENVNYTSDENSNAKAIELEEKFENLGKKFEEHGDDFGEKMTNFGSKIATKATSFAEKIMDKLDKAMDNGLFENHIKNCEKYEEFIEEDLSDINNIKIKTSNGRTIIKSTDSEKMKINVISYVKHKSNIDRSNIYKIAKDNNLLNFEQIHYDNVMLNLEVLLPKKQYNDLSVQGSNGSIKLYDLKSGLINLRTTNGKIAFENISSNKIDSKTTNASITANSLDSNELLLDTKNGRIIVDNSKSKELISTTSNASITVENSDFSNMYCTTKNGKIGIKNVDDKKLEKLNLITSNASISVDIDTTKDISFDLSTTNDRISLNVPNLIYKTNSNNRVLAQTQNYTEDGNTIKISATTKNGSVSFNK